MTLTAMQLQAIVHTIAVSDRVLKCEHQKSLRATPSAATIQPPDPTCVMNWRRFIR